MATNRSAFTLIELLVVVAIIAILAAIAVPNFLDAQTRAKVSRTKADLRTLAVSFEMYRVDTNYYPPDFDSGIYGVQVDGEGRTYASITTPIAYITTPPTDSFTMHETFKKGRYFQYWGEDAVVRTAPDSSAAKQSWLRRGVSYVMYSVGPDRRDEALGANQDEAIGKVYDPTNGTVSAGDVGISNRGFLPQ
jgi:type II secretion system protein G